MLVWIMIGTVMMLFILFIIYISHRMTRPERMIGDWTPDELGLDHQDISFMTEDDVELKGWWMDKGKEKTVICLHGYTSSRWYDVYMKPLLDILNDKNFNILYFDFRAHGKSGGDRTTIGDKEILDLSSSIDWLKVNHENRCRKIGVIGYSMGAMVTLKGIASDKRIDCGITDSPPIDLDSTSARSLKYFAGLPPFLYYLIKPVACSLFGIDTRDMLPYAEQIDDPLFIIAGEDDPIVKISEVKQFYVKNRDQNGDVKIWTTDAKHVRSIQEYPEEYREKINSFLDDHL